MYSNTPMASLLPQTKDFQSTLSWVTQPSYGAIYSPSGLGWIHLDRLGWIGHIFERHPKLRTGVARQPQNGFQSHLNW